MHEFTFSDSVRPPQVVILRLPLLTYSLGNELTLLSQRNPFLARASADFDQLPIAQQILAVRHVALTCSRPWSAQFKPEKWLRTWCFFQRRVDWAEQISRIRQYLADNHIALPGPDATADAICAGKNGYEPSAELRGRTYGAPLIARLLHFVTQNDLWRAHGCASLYDFGYRLALNLYLVKLEQDGGLRIENEDEHDEKVNWDKLVAEARAEEARMAAAEAPSTPTGGEPHA